MTHNRDRVIELLTQLRKEIAAMTTQEYEKLFEESMEIKDIDSDFMDFGDNNFGDLLYKVEE